MVKRHPISSKSSEIRMKEEVSIIIQIIRMNLRKGNLKKIKTWRKRTRMFDLSANYLV